MGQTTMNITKIRSYSELILLKTFEERFNYLKLDGVIGECTFGSGRYLNQKFYNTPEWRRFRNKIIIRDNGCDMGLDGYDIYGRIHIHHINPITKEDILNRSYCLFDPENVICLSEDTHKLLTYGADAPIQKPIERFKNDTCPWRR